MPKLRMVEELEIRQELEKALQEDIKTGDITSNSVIPASVFAEAKVICKTDKTVVSGVSEATIVFDICNCLANTMVKEGSIVKSNTVVMRVKGNARCILKAERTALNFIMRMSGIATETKKFVDIVNDDSIKIASTRKTAPGLRYFDKKAVTAGGGYAHRMGLDDMILIKDNHIAIVGSIEKAIRLARKNSGAKSRIECEVSNEKEAILAIMAGADIVLLDNFSAENAAETIKELTKRKIRKRGVIEVSGGINMNNIGDYAMAKPDMISIGQITHSPKAADFSLEIVKSPVNFSC